MPRNTAPAAPAPNTGPGYWKNVSGAVHIIDFRLRKATGYGFHAFLTCILLPLLLIQCKISLYLGLVRCFLTLVHDQASIHPMQLWASEA